jgi:hypothetical protein
LFCHFLIVLSFLNERLVTADLTKDLISLITVSILSSLWLRDVGGRVRTIHEDLLDLIKTLVDPLHCSVEGLLFRSIVSGTSYLVLQVIIDHGCTLPLVQAAALVSSIGSSAGFSLHHLMSSRHVLGLINP